MPRSRAKTLRIYSLANSKGGLDQVASAGKKVGTQVKDFANQKKENVAEAIDAGKEAYRASGTEG